MRVWNAHAAVPFGRPVAWSNIAGMNRSVGPAACSTIEYADKSTTASGRLPEVVALVMPLALVNRQAEELRHVPGAQIGQHLPVSVPRLMVRIVFTIPMGASQAAALLCRARGEGLPASP